MITLIGGFIATVIIVIVSMEGKFGLYYQIHSLVLVVGGSFAILFFITPPNVLSNVWRALKSLFHNDENLNEVRNELIELSKSKNHASNSKNPLISYGHDLWAQGVDPNLFLVLLSQKKNELIEDRMDAVQSIKNFAKYPPALGMTGTVMGMVSLFANLDSKSGNIGESLAMAMTATFFGLILTNVFLSPLADRLQIKQVHHHRLYTSMYEVLLLINQDEPTSLIEDEVNKRVG